MEITNNLSQDDQNMEEKPSLKVEKATELLKEAGKEVIHEMKGAISDGWESFKNEMNDKISQNENAIKKLKEKAIRSESDVKSKISAKIDELEMKNIVLKNKLKNFMTLTKEKELLFKREFKEEITELGTALKDLFA